jgi:hypothetical protein
MNNLYVSKPCEEAKTVNQECAAAGQGFVTSNPQMLRIMDSARHVAQTDVPVLILGESGVGKDVLAGQAGISAKTAISTGDRRSRSRGSRKKHCAGDVGANRMEPERVRAPPAHIVQGLSQ